MTHAHTHTHFKYAFMYALPRKLNGFTFKTFYSATDGYQTFSDVRHTHTFAHTLRSATWCTT